MSSVMSDQSLEGTATFAINAFNARTLSAAQVASSFVPPYETFDVLARSTNSILVGPRGSGKTTLLKMLQPEALEAWRHDLADNYRNAIDYTGVFIATDRSWKEQLTPREPANPQIVEQIANSAFAVHVMREIVEAMDFRVHSKQPSSGHVFRRVPLDAVAEERLVRNLGRLADLGVEYPDLRSVAEALTTRLSWLGRLRNAIEQGGEIATPEWLNLDALDLAEATIDLCNSAAGDRDHQWALLFDELELAPSKVTTLLVDAMRGQNPRLLFKLSLAPAHPVFARLNLSQAATHGQDFELIRLTYPGQREAHVFTRDLLDAELRARLDASLPGEVVLGPSLFTSSDSASFVAGEDQPGRRDPYSRNSALWRAYSELAAVDPTFKEWLDRNDVDLDNLRALPPTARAAKLRKIRNLVVVRHFYRGAVRARSRKTVDLYTGYDALVTLVDGNPRMLKALVGLLFTSADRDRRHFPIPPSRQAKAVQGVVARFLAVVRATPAIDVGEPRGFQVLDLLDDIGTALFAGIVRDDFNANAPMTFRVDAGTSAPVVRALQLALNSGAIIHLPRAGSAHVPADLEGEEFRLSYMLAPRYGLPMRLGPSRGLRRLLVRARSSRLGRETFGTSAAVRRRPRSQGTFAEQLSLFDPPGGTP